MLVGIKWTFSYFFDIWLGQTNRQGELLWNYTCGGLDDDLIYSCVECLLGGVAATGHTASYGAGYYDVWLLRIPSNTGLVMYNWVVWIGWLMILPISISIIAVWYALHAHRPRQSEFHKRRK